MVPLHSKFPHLLIKQEVKWKLKQWPQDKGQSTKMMRFLVDTLLERESIKDLSLKELMELEGGTIKPIFTYVVSYFKLQSDGVLRSSLSDKLSHMPGRKKRAKTSPDANETI